MCVHISRLLRRSSTAAALIFSAILVSLLGGATASAATDLKYDFQPTTSVTAVGYTPQTGTAYSTVTGQGWVTESSLNLASASHVPLDLTARTRQRATTYGQNQSTIIHVETGAVPNVRGAFEVALPNGTYKVNVAVGDPDYLDSSHTVRVEGLPLITNFIPAGTQRVAAQEGTFTVTDGRLTIDEIGGTNTKLSSITIADVPPDTTKPAAPLGLAAVGGSSQVTLNWAASSEPDVIGYDLYRSTSLPVSVGGTPLNGTTHLTTRTYVDSAVTNGTTYYYVVVAVDSSTNVSDPSTPDDGTPTAPLPAGFGLKVNFQPTASTVPVGYAVDSGTPFDAGRGFGFVREDSLASATHVGLDVTARARARAVNPDPRLDTLIHLNGAGIPSAAWEAAVPVGDYAVTVASGDPAYFDSAPKINVEGTNALNWTATSSDRQRFATVTVNVSDGRLTIDSIGGINSKLDYVTIDATTAGGDHDAPATPTALVAIADATGIHVSWQPNHEADLAGYRLYRSTVLPVPTTGAGLGGAAPIAAAAFTDTTISPSQKYYYSVVAVDTSGNASSGSQPLGITQPPRNIDLSVNFQPNAAPSVAGYTKDIGQPFDTIRGFGWVSVASLAGATHTPVDLTPNTRDRNAIADQRLDTFIQMQTTADTAGNKTPGAWEAAVPNGAYDVTGAVGDPSYYNSINSITVEGQSAISEFQPTKADFSRSFSATVNVTDGLLTIDPSGGINTKLDYIQVKTADAGTRPSVGDVSPADGATQVSRGRAVTAEVHLPNVGAGVDANTITDDTVKLTKVIDGSVVSVHANTSGGGDVIVVQPRSQLEANTAYRFTVTSGLKDVSGAAFIPKSTTFTTGTATSNTTAVARFTKAPQSAGEGEMMASLAWGPDDQLYATTLDGKILRFPVDPMTGTLGDPTTITTIADHENGARHVLGIAFDPATTATNPVLWVTHGDGAFGNAPDWTGKISRLSGPNLSVIQDYVTGLPRSVRDHETNSIAFGPDGALYLTQGSNSATGAPDPQWGLRAEHLLSAAILRVDLTKIPAGSPLDVKTEDGGTYNPFAADAPVTIYADGIRNAFDLVWHSNGELYSAVNGSAAGGNTPATPATLPASCSNRLDMGTNGPFTGPSVPGLTSIGTQDDLLLRVKPNAYYGHPNPTRCEYTFFGGNPTDGPDVEEAPEYPVGTMPDRNFSPASWNFGVHFSPDGMIEYKGNAWGGELNGALLVARYSAGDDIVALPIDPTTKEVTNQIDGVPGLGGMTDPLDLVENPHNGTVYVTELGAGRITLLTPDETGGTPKATETPNKVITSGVANSAAVAPKQTITLRNTGNAPLHLAQGSINLTGPNANQFTLSAVPSLPLIVEPDNEISVDVRFAPTSVGLKTASLDFTTDDPAHPTSSVSLRAYGTSGEFDVNEPSLQRIMDTEDIPISVGDDDPVTTNMPDGAVLGDEVPIQALRKAGAGLVKVEPLAVFSLRGPATAVGSFGWNETGTTDRTPLFSIPNTSAQIISPTTVGDKSFDPGDKSFGLWGSYAAADYTSVYSEDVLNTIAAGGAASHQARGYKLKNPDGTVVPNAYVVAFEGVAGPADFNDTVVIIRNVEPDGSGDGRVTLQNLDGAPFDDRMVFSRIGSLEAPPVDGVHDRQSIRVKNTGSTPLTISGTDVTGPFEAFNQPVFPVTVAVGAFVDLGVKFVATSGRVSNGTMLIHTNSPTAPTARVDLAGYWQPVPEDGKEPTLNEIVNELLGYSTAITNPGQSLSHSGRVEAVGDEVLAPYWRRLDPSKSSRVTQIAAYHGAGSAAYFGWFMKGGDQVKGVIAQAPKDAQSMFPHQNGSTTNLATATYFPTAEFGFNVDGGEWSDPKLNNSTTDVANGCAAPAQCGHHVRAWPVKNRTGQLVPGSYIIVMDYAGINYDYQDNVYLVTNITPDTESQQVIARVDAGSSTPYTDTQGRVWKADTGLFTGTPLAEGNPTDAIANTQDDRLYATYRGNVGSIPQAQRSFEYRIPTATATKVDVRLNFAERFWNGSGQRRINILTEDVQKIGLVDIFASAPGKNVAWSMAFNNIPVTDGVLNLKISASVDQPSISAFEVLCAETCGSD